MRRRAARWTAGAAALAGAAAASCVAPSRGPPPPPVEFEAAACGGEPASSWTASGGRALRLTAATPPVVVPRPAPSGADGAVLWIRLATSGASGGVPLLVRFGAFESLIDLPATGHRDRFEWWAYPFVVGSVASVELALDGGGDGELLLDQFAWGSDRAVPPAAAASPPVWRDGSLELCAAVGGHVFDPEWVQHLLREQYAAVARLLGRELRGPLLLVALPAAQWPRPGAGAFQQGRAIYLRDDELHLPWRSFAHEIAHVFEEERATALPRFWSEGLACALADEVEARLYDRGVPRARVRWSELLARGDARWRPGAPPPNPALAFAAPADEAGGDRRDYEWAGAVVDALAQAGGPDYFARLEARLGAPPPDGPPDPAAAVALDPVAAAAPFAAAARVDVAPLLRRAGIPWPPAAPRGTPPGDPAAAGSR